MVVPTGQLVRPAGKTLAFSGRPLDIALSPESNRAFVKTTDRIIVLDATSWEVIHELAFPKGESGSMHGLLTSRDGSTVFASGSGKTLFEAQPNSDGRWEWKRAIIVSDKNSNPCGVALSADERTAYLCLSISNSLAIIDLATGKVVSTVPTGVCPYGVVLDQNGKTAYVSNFGGRRARENQHTESSVGTPVEVDVRSVSIGGTVTRIDLASNKATGELEVGLHPADLKLSVDGKYIFVANANSDSVSVIDLGDFRVQETIDMRPQRDLPFGSITNALAVSNDGKMLFVANGGNNALAVVSLSSGPEKPSNVRGFLPTGWFPGAVCTDGKDVYVVNVKGEGSRQREPGKRARVSHQLRGSVTKAPIPGADQLAAYTRQVLADARVPQMLAAQEKSQRELPAVPVPERTGEPSLIEHVVYVIKENKTYDQVFGDLPQGNGEPKFCTYGQKTTPNHHALAEEFVLLDNYYCNGVCSADGHQWATQGTITDYQEKGMGVRSYDFGTDALAYANCNFIWDGVLLSGQSFRNYGEFDFPSLTPGNPTWFDVYRDFQNKTGKIGFVQSISLDTLRNYTCRDYPGWNMNIPDVLRLEAFLKEFREFEKQGQWPNFLVVYLPQDHTAGTGAEVPTPRAFVADNDLALGRLVEAISRSRFWAKTVIFVNEDDPQSGWDHVDGHRSICLVVGPHVKHHTVVHRFYNQLSVLHTMERILRLPSSVQLTAQAPVMDDCFTNQPDVTPYSAKPSSIALDEPNLTRTSITGTERQLVDENEVLDLSRPDRVDDDHFNRILWHASMGNDVPYPAEFAGSHGKGLAALHLKRDPNYIDTDD